MADILLVTRGASFDDNLESYLEGTPGYVVTQHHTDNPPPGNVLDYDLIITGYNVGSSDIGTDYRDLAVPVLGAHSSSWATALSLCEGILNSANGTGFEVVDADHEISVAAGLSLGVNIIKTESSLLTRSDGVPGTSQPVAHYAGSPEVGILFVYESGSIMANNITAQARRGAFGFGIVSSLNTLGQATLDATIEWLLSPGPHSTVAATYFNALA